MDITKPMLAGKVEDVKLLRFPLIGSPKLDGIRAFMRGGKLLSRTGKPIKNNYIRTRLEAILPDGADGELMAPGSFQDITSTVMTASGEPKFVYNMFDIASDKPYCSRVRDVECACLAGDLTTALQSSNFVQVVPTEVIHSLEELAAFEEKVLAQGYEGVILRLPDGPYKQGRSTFKEHYLLKLKRFEDSEAEILGFVEKMHNGNSEQRNEVGYMDRSSSKAGLTPCGTLGAFTVRDVHTGVEFEIGTGKGLTAALRQEVWNNHEKYLGRIIRYQHFAIGAKDKPRIPSFQGFRDESDFDV
jgi:DNA ligase-1